MLELIFIELPIIDPLIKLKPKMKLIGNSTVSSTTKSTLLLFELFCIPIIRNINIDELNIMVKKILLMR